MINNFNEMVNITYASSNNNCNINPIITTIVYDIIKFTTFIFSKLSKDSIDLQQSKNILLINNNTYPIIYIIK